jgi:hypothetical protein
LLGCFCMSDNLNAIQNSVVFPSGKLIPSIVNPFKLTQTSNTLHDFQHGI